MRLDGPDSHHQRPDQIDRSQGIPQDPPTLLPGTNRHPKRERYRCQRATRNELGFPFWPSRYGQGTPIQSSDASFSTEASFPVVGGPGLTFNDTTCGSFPFQSDCAEAVVAKVKADGASLDYAGYLGGTGDDRRNGSHRFLSGWLNNAAWAKMLHYATLVSDNGKRRRRYRLEDYRTPYEKLLSLGTTRFTGDGFPVTASRLTPPGMPMWLERPASRAMASRWPAARTRASTAGGTLSSSRSVPARKPTRSRASSMRRASTERWQDGRGDAVNPYGSLRQ